MIEFRNLKKTYGSQDAVNIPNLTIQDGTVLGLVGNNGAGKTTLFRLMLDLVKTTEGEVIICRANTDKNINPAVSEEWKSFTGAYINEGFLIDFLSAEEYFHFVCKVNNISADKYTESINAYSDFLTDEILGSGKLIRDLSAGNRQKVGIVSALLANPDIVVLDEPFNYLDPSSQNKLKRLLADYHQRTGATMLVSSHNLLHTVDISTHVALMEHGKILEYLDNSDDKTRLLLEEYFA